MKNSNATSEKPRENSAGTKKPERRSSINKIADEEFPYFTNKINGGQGNDVIHSTTNTPAASVAPPTSTVEISISCRDLQNKDILSKSDPMVVVYHRPSGSNRWVEFLRTETIKDDLNPDFAIKVTMEYRFEECQLMRFEVYDIDNPQPNLQVQDYLGNAECTLAKIVSAGTNGLTLPLSDKILTTRSNLKDINDDSAGSIILTAEELASIKDEVSFKFSGKMVGITNCCFIPAKTYYVISKINPAGGYVIIHRSEVARGRDPIWNPVTISMRSLCNGDGERGIKIECCQVKIRGQHSPIAYCLTTLNDLISLSGTGELRLTYYDNSKADGRIFIEYCKISPIYTFVDYIQNGTQIHACFAVDFTSSNGDPNDPCSLHHFSSNGNINPYEQAINSVGKILQDYDQEKKFPVYGFGARIPPNGAVSHNFFVTLSETGYCEGISGVIESYRSCIKKIQLYGPTNFSHIIRHVTDLAAKKQNGDHYFILLIITDGEINDMPQTKEAIIEASVMPVSIIICGVGGADFEAMEELDGDSDRITFNKRSAARDIVQFVPYRDAYSWLNSTEANSQNAFSTPSKPAPSGDEYSISSSKQEMAMKKAKNEAIHKLAQIKLAQEVLAEIPDQLTSYMKSRGFFPLKIEKEVK